LHGKLRSLGRLLLIAGQKLVEASSRRAAWLDTSVVVSDEVLHVSGTALQGAAKALLKDRWDRARHFLSVARDRSQVNPLFPQEQLEVLKGMLSGSSALVDTTAALAGFGRTLERQAERVSEACSCLDGRVCGQLDQLEDAFFDAAGALSAAARLFDKKARVASPDAGSAAVAVEPSLPRAASAFAQIDQALATASSPQQRRSVLRELAKQFHPDRHPGREAEVLAAFRHVQKLRSEERWMEQRWGA
jgi:hypothetical protein